MRASPHRLSPSAQPFLRLRPAAMPPAPSMGAVAASPTTTGACTKAPLPSSQHDDIDRILWRKEELQQRIEELGRRVGGAAGRRTRVWAQQLLLIVGVKQ